MTDLEMRDRIGQLHTTVYGVEGQGGLVREVEKMDKRIDAVEEKVNSISAKWIALMTVMGILGNIIFQILYKAFNFAPVLFHK